MPYPLESPRVTELVRSWLRRSAVGRASYRLRRNRMADVFVLSFPKTGRTWLRLLLGKALSIHHGVAGDAMAPDKLAAQVPGLARVRFKHDDNPHFKAPHELVSRKTEYRDRKVIFLVRDVRDTLVSAYFQMTRREPRYRFDGPIEKFLRCPRGSVETIIRFYNIWADQRRVPAAFLLVRYEDMHADTARELRRVLDFIGQSQVSDEAVRQAVEFCRFENMRKMEQQGSIESSRMVPGNASDPESFKTRKGKIGGYVEYLDAEDIRWLDDKVRRELDPFFGY